jgi:hypothetical protein
MNLVPHMSYEAFVLQTFYILQLSIARSSGKGMSAQDFDKVDLSCFYLLFSDFLWHKTTPRL